MLKLAKYSLLLFILTTISMAYRMSPIKSFETQLNIGAIALGIILGLLYPRIIFGQRNMHIFKVVFGLLFVNFFYQLTFGWLNFRMNDVLYLIAKISFTIIVVISVVLYPNFYFKEYLKWIGFLLAFLIILGFIYSQTDELSGRYNFGFSNPNDAGVLAALGFGIFLIKDDVGIMLKYGLLFLFALTVIISGSRSSLIFLLMAFIFKYKFNYRLVLGFLILAIFAFNILPYLNISTLGVDRLMGTFGVGNLHTKLDRASEFEAGYLMFLNKFWTGYGLTGYKIIDFNLAGISRGTLGTHNGYICAAKMYGVIFLIPFLYIIISNYIRVIYNYFNSKIKEVSLNLFIISVGIIGALAEDYLIGVNELITILCLSSFSVLEYYRHIEKAQNNSVENSTPLY